MKNSFINADNIKLEYRFLHLLASFYVIIFLTAEIINLKIIKLGHLTLYGEAITYPFLYGMLVMVMEIYGFEQTRQLIWITILSYLIFVAFISITMILPSPNFWIHANEYNFILELLVQRYYIGLVMFSTTAFLTCYVYQFLSDRKYSLRSRKSIFMLSVGFGIATHLALSGNLVGMLQGEQTYIDSFYLIAIIFVFISFLSKFSDFLKKRERISEYRNKVCFNPFSLKVYRNVFHNNFTSFKLYHYVAVLFILFFVTSKIAGAKFISIHGLVFTSGSLIFPVSYIFSDILTEVYGFERARQLIWIAVICNCIFVAFLFFSLMHLTLNIGNYKKRLILYLECSSGSHSLPHCVIF